MPGFVIGSFDCVYNNCKPAKNDTIQMVIIFRKFKHYSSKSLGLPSVLPFNLIIGIAIILGFASCSRRISYASPSRISSEQVAQLSKEKQLAYSFVAAPKNEKVLFDSLLSQDFTSHNQDWGSNKELFVKNRSADESFNQIEPIRILHDSSFVAVHSRMLGDTLKFRWDILRIENQKIREHWSNVSDSIGVNPNGHSEIDGPTVSRQLEQTSANRALIFQFIDQCMIREDGGAVKFFNFRLYIQHNRDVGDGLSGLLWAMLKMELQRKTIKFKHNYHIIAEGDLVLSATEGVVGDEKVAFFDLFRIEENKIVEHWDLIAPIKDYTYYKSK